MKNRMELIIAATISTLGILAAVLFAWMQSGG